VSEGRRSTVGPAAERSFKQWIAIPALLFVVSFAVLTALAFALPLPAGARDLTDIDDFSASAVHLKLPADLARSKIRSSREAWSWAAIGRGGTSSGAHRPLVSSCPEIAVHGNFLPRLALQASHFPTENGSRYPCARSASRQILRIWDTH